MKQLTDEQFEEIVNKFSKTLFNIAYNYTRDTYNSEDIVQETFFKLYRAHKDFKNDDHLKYWLIRVTINNSLDVIRKKQKEVLIDDEDVNNLPDNNGLATDKGLIFNCILELKESYKTIIILHYYDNYSIKEIASILKITETNALTRLNRARNKLKNIIIERKNNE